MYVLQAILLFLKLASGKTLFHIYKAVPMDGYPTYHFVEDEHFIGLFMNHISWFLIFIPSYVIIGNEMLKSIGKVMLERVVRKQKKKQKDKKLPSRLPS